MQDDMEIKALFSFYLSLVQWSSPGGIVADLQVIWELKHYSAYQLTSPEASASLRCLAQS